MEQAQIISRLKDIHNEVGALIEALDPAPPKTIEVAGDPIRTRPILWGAKVSETFRAGVFWIEDKLNLDADNLMCCMAYETNQTFDPAIRNFAGSSGTGLIQFMRPTAIGLGTTVEDLAKMSAVRQLGFVYHYFRQFGSDFEGWTLEDTYMAILYPKAIGKPNDWPMPWKYGSIAYRQNSGLDLNKDQKITKAEASHGVRKMRELGARFKA